MKVDNCPRISLGNSAIIPNILSDYFNKGKDAQITGHYYILTHSLSWK